MLRCLTQLSRSQWWCVPHPSVLDQIALLQAVSPQVADAGLTAALQVRPLLANEQAKSAKTCCHISSDHTVVLSPRAAAAGPMVPDSERLAFQVGMYR